MFELFRSSARRAHLPRRARRFPDFFPTPVPVLALFLGALALAACSTEFKDTDSIDTVTIDILQNASAPTTHQGFSPNPVSVVRRTEVIWQNNDTIPHQIASVGDLFPAAAQPIPPGGKYSYIFNVAGSYRYYCLISGHREEGVINVLQ